MKLRFAIWIVLLVITGSGIINACKKNGYPYYSTPTPLVFNLPEGFPEPVYKFQNNPLTEEGFALGKKLFHDHLLSKNLDVSCGSCHQQHAAFTTFDHDLGHGTNHQHTTRNVPAIFNMAWHPAMQWDGSIASLEAQPLACMTAPEKMGEEVDNVTSKLSADEEYRKLFGKAFGDEKINWQRISLALTQFVASLVSANSKYDEVKKGTLTFNASEENGYLIFKINCASCHAEPLFSDFSYRNNGLPLNQFHADYGRMQVTGNSNDSLKFKVPSLRNVALTAYYTHDGRFNALSEMISHYSDGIVNSATLDPLLVNKIPLSDLEKFYLQEFLFTLTDSSLVLDPRFE